MANRKSDIILNDYGKNKIVPSVVILREELIDLHIEGFPSPKTNHNMNQYM